MGIRDALKSLRGGEKMIEEDISASEAPEPTWFRPRYDGSYVGTASGTTQLAGPITLRFLPGGKVFETTGPNPALGETPPDPCRGEYTGAGRFNVQRKFERIISYAVLDNAELDRAVLDNAVDVAANGFNARRINTADRSTAELRFVFRPERPDDPAAGSPAMQNPTPQEQR